MKMKKLFSLSLVIFTMFFMVGEVSAATTTSFKNSGLNNITIIKKGNLGYYVASGFDVDARQREQKLSTGKYNGTTDALLPMHGSINVFGYDGDHAYEMSAIVDKASLGTKTLTGIFPVFYIGNGSTLDVTKSLFDAYNYLTPNNNVLTGTKNNITVTVTPSHVLNNQFIKLTYVAKNNGTADQVISMAGYSDIALDGIDNAAETPAERIISNETGFTISSVTTENKTRKMYVITDNFTEIVNNDDISYWIGNKKVDNISNPYSKAFKSSNNTYDTTNSEKDSAMAFSWNNITLKAGEEVTRSILIGLGDISPLIDVTGKTEFNLDNDTVINGNIQYIVPTDGNAYKLYYKLNDQQTPTTVADADLTKRVDATKVLDLINDENLNKCGENTLTAWIGPADDSKLENAIVSDEHKFVVTSAICVPEKQEESPQTGVNTNYLILGIILIGGIGVYIYGRKHNKFPQV